MSIPDQVKHAADAGVVPAGVTAWLNLLNPIFDTILVVVTITWVVYRIIAMYKDRNP